MSAAAGGLRRYADVLAAPGIGRVVTIALLARLPSGMAPLAMVLLVRGEGGSYGVAGLVVACSTLACAVSWPLAGRLVDRIGLERVLLPQAVGYPIAFGGLALLASRGAPVAALAVCAAAVGATVPPVGACMRALWPSLLAAEELRDTAYALESWLQELIFIIGPLIVAALALVAPPWVIVATAAVLCVGTAWFALIPAVRAAPRSQRARSRAGALGSAGVRTVLIASLAAGGAFGVVEVCMPAFAEAHGSRAEGGLALACFACGSLLGGLWIGTRPPAPRLWLRFTGSLVVLALVLLPPLVAPSLPVMCALMLVAGMPIAPAFAASYGLIGELTVPGTITEAFAWLGTALFAGLSLGTSIGGTAVERLGLPGALALAAPCAAGAALLAFVRRGSLAVAEPVP